MTVKCVGLLEEAGRELCCLRGGHFVVETLPNRRVLAEVVLAEPTCSVPFFFCFFFWGGGLRSRAERPRSHVQTRGVVTKDGAMRVTRVPRVARVTRVMRVMRVV